VSKVTLGPRVLAAVLLVALAPVLIVIACAIAVEDGGPILFRQKRVGKCGQCFDLVKFRSMRREASGASLTASGDARVTRIGSFIRHYKLDELPQLWNVMRGDIGLIGPRPEVPCFVDLADPLWRATLELKPGITGLATLIYREEERLLGRVSEPEHYYRGMILPDKLRLNVEYSKHRTWRSDLQLLWLTLRASISPRGCDAEYIRRLFAPGD
jgi:lipopolysaccharide/colanic/teichoic acid biosynthesis glycosyltransferase